MKLPAWLSILAAALAVGVILRRSWRGTTADWFLAVIVAGLLLGGAIDVWLKVK